jgi:beta-glucosidase-like glycosyl hydrolase
VNDLLGRMSLDDKIGQMTQVERTALQSQSDLANFRIGSVLSGGGSAPSPNNATSWANMYDGFQQTALSTPLGIPIIYGADAVHGHSNVVGTNTDTSLPTSQSSKSMWGRSPSGSHLAYAWAPCYSPLTSA